MKDYLQIVFEVTKHFGQKPAKKKRSRHSRRLQRGRPGAKAEEEEIYEFY